MVVVLAFVALVTMVGLGAGPASAHNYLVTSTPAPGSVVTEPLGAVTLEFNDVVLNLVTNTSFVEVTDAQGAHFETACPTTADRTVTAPIALGAAGEYRIVWQIVSADGHVVSDQQVFTYEPAAGVPEAAGSATAPCPSADAGSGSGPEEANLAPTDADQQASGSNTALILSVAGGIVLLALIGVGVVMFLARSKNHAGTGE